VTFSAKNLVTELVTDAGHSNGIWAFGTMCTLVPKHLKDITECITRHYSISLLAKINSDICSTSQIVNRAFKNDSDG